MPECIIIFIGICIKMIPKHENLDLGNYKKKEYELIIVS